MMKRVVVLLALALSAATAFAAETQRYLISTRSVAHKRNGAPAVLSAQRNLRSFANIPNVYAADLTAGEVAKLKASGDIEMIEPAIERHILGFESAPIGANTVNYTVQQHMPYGISLIGAPDVWPVSRGSANVHVAVVDTGIDKEHPDLKHAYMGGVNIVEPGAEPLDDNHHGTHVAGTIAAADNGYGVVGVAPNVKLWAVKILDSRGKGTSIGLVTGIDWIIGKSKTVGGRWVINLSLGSRFGSEIEQLAIGRALAANIAVVAAAGNTGQHGMQYPAGYRGVIAVGAVDSERKLASFSSWGVGMTVVAPGVQVISSVRGGIETSADVTQNDQSIAGAGINGSPYGTVTGRLVDCKRGLPEDFPSNMAGKIALMERGDIQFREKTRNAKNVGAAAVVIYNTADRADTLHLWTLVPSTCDPVTNVCGVGPEWEGYQFPVAVGLSTADGARA
jgi:serine protease